MSIAKTIKGNPVQFAIAAAVVVGIGYFVSRQLLRSAGGLVTGNNAITEGTSYAGKGLVGTVAAATDKASGGLLESFGGWLGGKIYDATHADYDPNNGLTSKAGFVRQAVPNTNDLWGPIGGVILKQ